MKKSAIIDIFHGLKGNSDTMQMPKEHFENGDHLCKMYDELKEKCSPDLFKLHKKLIDAIHLDYSEEVEFYFAKIR